MKHYEIPKQIIDDIGSFWMFSAQFANDQKVIDIYYPRLKANLSYVATQISKACNDRDLSISQKMIPFQLAEKLNGWLGSCPIHYQIQFSIHKLNDVFYFAWKINSNTTHTITFKICTKDELDQLFKDAQ